MSGRHEVEGSIPFDSTSRKSAVCASGTRGFTQPTQTLGSSGIAYLRIVSCSSAEEHEMENRSQGPVAQLGERSFRTREVEGSNPFRSTDRQLAQSVEQRSPKP
jgi:hypothetical protein